MYQYYCYEVYDIDIPVLKDVAGDDHDDDDNNNDNYDIANKCLSIDFDYTSKEAMEIRTKL